MMKPALLVIDLQKAFHQGVAATSMDGASATINEALALFRNKQLPIVWIQHSEEAEGVVPGSPGFDFIDSLVPGSGERRVRKTYNNSFNKTELEAMLRADGVDTVILAGYCAEYCIMATYWGAMNLDIRPFLLKKAIASDVERNVGLVGELTSTIALGELSGKLSAC